MKLIIVDDEPKIRKGLTKLLDAQEGFQVTGVFEDVHSALKALYELEADVIITDIKMPEVSGLELIRQIRERNLNIRIIILSGYSNFSYAQKAIELGVTRYLLKPTDSRELLSVLRELEQELFPETHEKEERQDRPAEGENEVGNLLVLKAIQYIAVHYGGRITLTDMAGELHLSPNYLCELFKRHTGKNLMEYVTEYRMQKAKSYLNHVEYKVADVAEMVGYKEAKYFSSAFKKAYGITPLEYRNRRQSHLI
ncbi:response regulator transcription factor [Lacrimispora sphenoides]|uniref:Stage 0 sporulation protein A homolog n=1 Tax=Lacrimispora sphenoides JCM 1415 TaxID=1297793 RepID=A0ABY1C918_9FIRM|nr:response regulator [Lacrimispora sphenoides]SET80922.1 Helix-turn-helix domain-containing protein [[Clostridium] sphenoides JCM 1415]SUY51442.1 AraC family transcriptional regulator [Lacrimispora sphenoides]